MSDFEVYSAALEADSSYAATLSRSLSLVLEEFYSGIKTVGVSAVTGEGMEEFFEVRGIGWCTWGIKTVGLNAVGPSPVTGQGAEVFFEVRCW
jgi:hypothetical protein